MIDWKNKEAGYYTDEGTMLFTWKELEDKQMIFCDTWKSKYRDTAYHYLKACRVEPTGGVLVLPNYMTDIHSDAFKYIDIKGVVLNEGLVNLHNRAFCECESLEIADKNSFGLALTFSKSILS